MKKRKLEVSVTVFGQDCTPPNDERQLTAGDLREAAVILLAGAAAIDARMHGAIEEEGIAHVGVDFGKVFSEKKGLPPIAFDVMDLDPIIHLYRPKKKRGKK